VATILRHGGFRVMIFTNNDMPPHVHIFKAGTEAVIGLVPIAIRDNYRMSKSDLRNVLDLVAENRDQLLEAWRGIHDRQ
jgi:hypothetical protein